MCSACHKFNDESSFASIYHDLSSTWLDTFISLQVLAFWLIQGRRDYYAKKKNHQRPTPHYIKGEITLFNEPWNSFSQKSGLLMVSCPLVTRMFLQCTQNKNYSHQHLCNYWRQWNWTGWSALARLKRQLHWTQQAGTYEKETWA